MTVKAILSHKGNDVVTIKPTATLCDAAEILDEHGIGAVVITGAAATPVIRPESTIAQAVASATTRCCNGCFANVVRKNWSPASRSPTREQPISNEIPAPGETTAR
jgi:CBS domain-containing protein